MEDFLQFCENILVAEEAIAAIARRAASFIVFDGRAYRASVRVIFYERVCVTKA